MVESQQISGNGSNNNSASQTNNSTTQEIEGGVQQSQLANSNNNIENLLIHRIAVNQTKDLFAVATHEGMEIYSLDPFQQKTKHAIEGGLKIVKMLNKTNFLVLIGTGNNPAYPPTKVFFWDIRKEQAASEMSFSSEVHDVSIREDKLIVVLSKMVIGYKLKTLKPFVKLQTFDNPRGAHALNLSIGKFVIAVPGLDEVGKVQLVHYNDNFEETNRQLVTAHQNALSCMTLNSDGTLLATCSIQGTLIRLFKTENGEKLGEMRRGKDPAIIHSLSFDPESKFLACCSDRKTIHIFKVGQEGNTTSYFRMMSPVISYCGSEWSFANVWLENEIHPIATIINDHLYVLTLKGKYYKVQITAEGGQLALPEPQDFNSYNTSISSSSTNNNVSEEVTTTNNDNDQSNKLKDS